ncbi:MAG: preprotein translocase subunit SecG [Patescibacteria group bacterium]
MLQTILHILPFIQITLAVILVILILLQPTDADAGGSFGGGAVSTWHTRRGAEKAIFTGTIVVAILFVASVILDLLG